MLLLFVMCAHVRACVCACVCVCEREREREREGGREREREGGRERERAYTVPPMLRITAACQSTRSHVNFRGWWLTSTVVPPYQPHCYNYPTEGGEDCAGPSLA